MNTIPADGAEFHIWTDERLEALSEDPETEPLGRGTAMSDASGFTNWQGGSPEAEVYYVVVSSTGNADTQYLLNISSPALSLEQPGATTVGPGTPTATATPDPNIAVVTTAELNVRAGPSTDFPVITTVPNGTELTVLGRNDTDTWLAVQLEDGTQGWVTRSLTDYTLVAETVLSADLTPEPAPTETPLPGITATITTTTNGVTGTTGITETTSVTETTGVTVEETLADPLASNWQVLAEGETHWYTFQYRGGELPVTLWMDVEPFGGADFTVVDEATATSLMEDTTPSVTDPIGRGIANPIEPGYLFWHAGFAEADTYYVMVQHAGTGDTLYSINALGPGVGRTVQEAE
jgi:uncharacterized protein YraI